MIKYLLEILHEINTIIIPDLGAFTVTKKDTREVMFMPFLKHDDGNLSKIIAQKEGISDLEAKNSIAKFVREIHSKLDIGETYDMYQFGRFSKNNGEIEFQNWSEFNKQSPVILEDESTETPTESTISTEEKEDLLASLKKMKDNTEKIVIPKMVEDENVFIPNLNPEKTEIKTDLINENTAQIKEKTPEEKHIDKKIEQDPVKEESSSNPSSLEKETSSDSKPSDKKTIKSSDKIVVVNKKNNKKVYRLVAIFLILLGISGVGFIFKDNLINILNKKQENKIAQHEEIEEKEAEEIEEKVALEQDVENKEEVDSKLEEPIQKDPISEPTTQNSNQGTYHLIVGGFAVEENATRYAQKLQAESNVAKVLGKFDDKFLVSYASFSSKEEALNNMKTLSIEAWVFKYDK